MSRKKQEEKTPQSGSEKEARTPEARRNKVAALIKSIEDRLNVADGKSTVADFIRLVQYERELEQEQQPREMKVTWSEPSETYDTDE